MSDRIAFVDFQALEIRMSCTSEESIAHIISDKLTKPLPLYTHATVHNGVVYVSCQQGFIPGTFEFPSPAPADQARQSLANLKVILEQAGSSLRHVLKITIFMTDMRDFPAINEVVNEAFPELPPARSSIAVTALPREAKVAIEVIAAQTCSPADDPA
jgi:2-iminobutanoate/2-iminopropanoate deaminase